MQSGNYQGIKVKKINLCLFLYYNDLKFEMQNLVYIQVATELLVCKTSVYVVCIMQFHSKSPTQYNMLQIACDAGFLGVERNNLP